MSTKAQEENGRVFVIWCSFLVVYADEALWSVVGSLLRNLHHALQVDCVVAYVLSRMDYHGLSVVRYADGSARGSGVEASLGRVLPGWSRFVGT